MGAANRHLQCLAAYTESLLKEKSTVLQQAVARMLRGSRGIHLQTSLNTEGQQRIRASRMEIPGAAAQVSTEEAAPALQVLQASLGAEAVLEDRTAAAGRRDHLTEEDSLLN